MKAVENCLFSLRRALMYVIQEIEVVHLECTLWRKSFFLEGYVASSMHFILFFPFFFVSFSFSFSVRSTKI